MDAASLLSPMWRERSERQGGDHIQDAEIPARGGPPMRETDSVAVREAVNRQRPLTRWGTPRECCIPPADNGVYFLMNLIGRGEAMRWLQHARVWQRGRDEEPLLHRLVFRDVRRPLPAWQQRLPQGRGGFPRTTRN
jgi:hypothetical protein